MKNKLVTIILLMWSSLVLAQQNEVTGKVTDPSGMPLPGVNVVEKGTSNGTITNAEGEFRLNVSEGSRLAISFVGFENIELDVAGQTDLNVTLQEKAFELDEAVVTALGISQAKKTVGYSTQEIDPEALKKANSNNIGNLLSGKVAGLAVDNPTGMFQAPTFSLRGKTPLIVIDNIPMETDLFDLNPNDIAEINVLKGTTASALYGSRGRNGAILITTKEATAEGLRVTLANSTMFTAGYTVFPETQTEYGNGSNGQYEFWDGKDGGISDGDMIWGPKFEDGLDIPQWNSPIYDNVTGETIPWWGDVSGTKYDDKSRYSRVPIPWEYHNNLNDFLGTGYVTQTDFSVSYKSERTSYRLSGNYANQKGQVPNTSLQTGGLNLTSTFNITNSLKLDGRLSYSKVYSPNYPRYGYGPKNHIYTILIWMGDDVDGKDLAAHYYVPGQEGYRQANFNYAWYNNVYFAAHELNQEYDSDVVKGQLKLTWDITRDLAFQVRTSVIKEDRFEDRQSPKSYLNYGDPRDGDYKTWNSDWVTQDHDFLATYRRPLGSLFNLTVNAGGSLFNHKFQQGYSATDGIIVPDVYSLNNTKGNVKASTYVQEKEVRSIYGTVNFDLLDAFFLNFAARNDWSSALPESNNSYFYPSVSLSSVISNLVNMPAGIDYLKLYGAWAEVSSDLAPPDNSTAGYANPYQMEAYYSNSGSYSGMTMLTYPGGIVNPLIQPEKSTSYELGLSSSFISNRFNFDVTYYNVVDENQIINLPISAATGFTSRKVNGNQYTTNGVEVVVNAKPISNSVFGWDLTLNWDRRVKKLTEIYGNEDKFGNYSLNERVDNYYSTGWMKSPDGEVILSEETGLPIRDPFPQNFGHIEPDWRFGLMNQFRYKNLTLGLDIDGMWGGIMRSLTVEKMWWGGKHPNSTEYRDAEYAAGEPIYVPDGVNVVSGELTRDTDGNIISDTRVFQENETKVSWQTWCQNYPYRAKVTEEESEDFANIFDRSFIKLRRVSLSYDLTSVVKVRGFQGIELTAFGYNLWMYKKAIIIDPDFGNDNNLQDPSARYLGMKVELTF
ncbi:MAG: SusC/RagA family TonB-linked outer membrane protein [Bacteroidota bacterium]